MSDQSRTPLAPAAGLSRAASIPPPPPRRSAAATGGGRQRSGKRPETRAQASTEAETMRAISLSVPASLVAQFKKRARAEDCSQPDLLMDAITIAKDDLGDLLADHGGATSDGLFVRRHRPASEPTAVVSLRMLASNVKVIDELVAQHGASSRSALCVAALRHHLS